MIEGPVIGGALAAAGLALAATSDLAGTVSRYGAVFAFAVAVVAAIYSAKLRTTLEATKGSAEAWREERDAEIAKASRLSELLREAEADRRALAARTDLTELRQQIGQQHQDAMEILGAIRTALELIAAGDHGEGRNYA
jgi:hypothetical protein